MPDPTPRRREMVRKLAIAAPALAILGGLAALAVNVLQGDATPKRHVVTTITTVKLPPPPPPPPPPPAPPQKEEPAKVEEAKIKEPEAIKPQEQRPDPAPSPPAGLGFAGEGGPGGYGDIGTAGGGGGGGSGSGTGSGGNVQAWYAGVVIRHFEDALRKHEKTRKAAFRVVIRAWFDGRGAVTRVELGSSTGDPQTDAAIIQALQGVVFSDAPPADLPQPVQVRIGARRPS